MKTIAIIGGGAAGFFAAIHIAEMRPDYDVHIFEATKELLSKVKISGGGRCNVTHYCFDPRKLVQSYPRGQQELRGPFHHFGPEQLVAWFQDRGVQLHVEEDGRMFPQSNSSQTIIDCFRESAHVAGVQVHKQRSVSGITNHNSTFDLLFKDQDTMTSDYVLLASGSSASGHRLASSLGHQIVDTVPSLFTFKCDSWVRSLAGLGVEEVEITLPLAEGFQSSGPILCTHWGLSGPAVLRLSSWAARDLFAQQYACEFFVNWLPQQQMQEFINEQRAHHGGSKVANQRPQSLPKRLWLALCEDVAVDVHKSWSQLSKQDIYAIVNGVHKSRFVMNGKTTFKEEFVTAGGVDRTEINWKRMESQKTPGLFFAGECIDVDAITGGFNFQNAWTTAYIAAHSMCED